MKVPSLVQTEREYGQNFILHATPSTVYVVELALQLIQWN